MSAKKSSKASQSELEPVKSEYTYTDLIRHHNREELNEVALSFGLNGRRYKNKEMLATAIMREVYEGDDVLDAVTGLNPKQEMFCQIYTGDREFYGNGTQSYIEAYDIDLSVKGAYDSARTCASKLLTNINILERITALQNEQVLNDEYVDKKTAFWIRQEAYPMASLAAIKEYNKVRKRVDSHMMPVALTQNNYSVNINDERGKYLSNKYQGFMEHVTKRETAPEDDKARRVVPADIVSKMTSA